LVVTTYSNCRRSCVQTAEWGVRGRR